MKRSTNKSASSLNSAPSQRQKRANEVIRRALSNVMISGHFSHATFSNYMVHITNVAVSPDLRQAKIYVMALNQPSDDQQAFILATLKEERTHLRKELAKHLTFKFVPDLKFFWDEEVEYADHIESLMRKHSTSNIATRQTHLAEGNTVLDAEDQSEPNDNVVPIKQADAKNNA